MEEDKHKDTNAAPAPAVVDPAHKLPSAFDLFSPSMEAVKRNLPAFLILIGVPIVLSLIGQGPHLFRASAAGVNEGPLGVVGLVGGVLSLLAGPGLILLQIKGAQNETPLAWDAAFKQGLHFFWRYLGLALLTTIVLIISLALLIVPFFFVLPRLFLAPFFLIDKNMGVVDSMKASWKTYGERKGTWGVMGVFVLIGIALAVPVVGWIVG